MPRASKRAYEEFVKSAVWDDLKELLTDRLALVRDDLESEKTIEETQKLRGEAASLRFIVGLPDRMISEYENLVKEEESWLKGQGEQQEEKVP